MDRDMRVVLLGGAWPRIGDDRKEFETFENRRFWIRGDILGTPMFRCPVGQGRAPIDSSHGNDSVKVAPKVYTIGRERSLNHYLPSML